MTIEELFKFISEFLKVYWKEFVALVLYIIAIVVSACKRKVKVSFKDVLATLILEALPSAITKAEELIGAGNGKEKYEMVFNSIIKLIVSKTDMTEENAVSVYGDFIRSAIENILCTPQKKGN